MLAENYNECYHCGPVHPELCDLVPSFRRAGGDSLDWEHGIPHREGAYTFTTTGTTTRAPFPDLDEDELVRHKGELAFPNLLLSLCCDHIAAFLLTPRGPGHTTIGFDLLFHPDAIADPRLRPLRRARALGRGQPSGLADLRERPARDGVAWIHAGLVRTRWRTRASTSAAWYEPRMTDPTDVTESATCVVVGLGALGQRDLLGARRAPGWT